MARGQTMGTAMILYLSILLVLQKKKLAKISLEKGLWFAQICQGGFSSWKAEYVEDIFLALLRISVTFEFFFFLQPACITFVSRKTNKD